MTVRISPTLAVAALLAVSSVGCAEDLRFTRDDRVAFLSPPERSEVRLPLLVSWAVDQRRFTPSRPDGLRRPRRGFFAVFVDRSPMRPGQGIDALASGDPSCRAETDCPDRTWLRRHGVYLTAKTRIGLEALPADGGRKVGSRRLHEVTIVLLDGRGVRLDDSQWTRRFFFPRGAA